MNTTYPNDFVLLNALLVDPYNKDSLNNPNNHTSSLLIEQGSIKYIATQPNVLAPELFEHIPLVFDCQNTFVFPLLTDARSTTGGLSIHNSFSELSKSAVFGGVGSIFLTSNDNLSLDNEETLLLLHKYSQQQLPLFYFCPSLTKHSQGRELNNLLSLNLKPKPFFSDPHPLHNNYLLYQIMNYASPYNIVVSSYPQDTSLSAHGDVNEGPLSLKLGLHGIPRVSEDISLMTHILLAKETGCRYHASLISSANSLNMIRNAKNDGVKITCDTSPPYFSFNENISTHHNTNYKLFPPLRSEQDRLAIKQGLRDGTIDMIVSNHSPQLLQHKNQPFSISPFGSSLLEYLLPLSFSQLSDSMSVTDIVSKLTYVPSNTFNTQPYPISENTLANLLVFNPHTTWIPQQTNIPSPYFSSITQNMNMLGKVVMSVYNGRILHNDLIT